MKYVFDVQYSFRYNKVQFKAISKSKTGSEKQIILRNTTTSKYNNKYLNEDT